MKKEISINNQNKTYSLSENDSSYIIKIDNKDFVFDQVYIDNGNLIFKFENKKWFVPFSNNGSTVFCDIAGRSYSASKIVRSFSKKIVKNEGYLSSPMPGKIVKILKTVGDAVVEGDAILVMEAMKMEHTLKAPKSGVIEAIHYKEGELVEGGVSLIELGEKNASS